MDVQDHPYGKKRDLISTNKMDVVVCMSVILAMQEA
jgi:hypothetical protein